jgi:hypothetical protein
VVGNRYLLSNCSLFSSHHIYRGRDSSPSLKGEGLLDPHAIKEKMEIDILRIFNK